MNEKEFFQFAKNKIFVYQSGYNQQGKKDGPINVWVRVFLIGGEPQNFLTVIFNADHTLTYLAKLGFLPGERNWQFDEKNQQINLFDESGNNLLSAYSLPANFNEGHFILNKVNDPTKRYLAFTTFDIFKKVQQEPTFASQRLLLWCDSQSAMPEQEINQYEIQHCCELKNLANNGADLWAILNQAWDLLTQDEKLKEVCVLLQGKPELAERFFSKELLIKTQSSGQQYLAGSRSDVLIVLSQLLIKHYEEQLSGVQTLHTPLELLGQVVTA